MEFDGRSLLLGAGLFGMVVGATLGLVAGDSYRECVGSFFGGDAPVCEGYRTLRIAAFGLVGISAAVALVPIVGALRDPGPGGRARIVWKR